MDPSDAGPGLVDALDRRRILAKHGRDPIVFVRPDGGAIVEARAASPV